MRFFDRLISINLIHMQQFGSNPILIFLRTLFNDSDAHSKLKQIYNTTNSMFFNYNVCKT